jgi:hypothetical protein
MDHVGRDERMMIGMTDRDPAFLWETKALRNSPQRVAEIETDGANSEPGEGRWVTLREASRATGIPVETLRKWARKSTVPTYLTATAAGPNIRMVDLEGVAQRATDLGRPLSADPGSQPVSDRVTIELDAESARSPEDSNPPPGTMIVPIDAWNKMLNQLGNLHEAGQQLATARERAAKAETEASFLRERLAELRTESESTAVVPAAAEESPAADTPEGAEPPPEKVWQFFVRRMRTRRTG